MAAGMHYTFAQAQDPLRAELFGRQTAEEALSFVEALATEARNSAATRVLVWVRNPGRFSSSTRCAFPTRSSSSLRAKCALRCSPIPRRCGRRSSTSRSSPPRQGARLRAFRDEARALAWLRSVSPAQSQE